MPKAKKLKSGSWTCTVFAGYGEDGKRKYKSFTVKDPTRAGKKECERLAAEWAAQHQDRPGLRTAVLLAAFGSLRRGEICALRPEDMVGNRIYICKSMVRDIDGYWHVKPMAKTDESNRIVILPPQVAAMIELPVKLHPEQVSNRFRRAVRSSGCEHIFRFHDLRHYYVSIAHALGVPDAYIMQMGGWKTDTVMHRVYRDTLPDVMAAEQEKLTQHFDRSFCKTFCMDAKKSISAADASRDQTQKIRINTGVSGSNIHADFDILVPAVGLEPTRPLGQQILSLPRLPFRHAGMICYDY